MQKYPLAYAAAAFMFGFGVLGPVKHTIETVVEKHLSRVEQQPRPASPKSKPKSARHTDEDEDYDYHYGYE